MKLVTGNIFNCGFCSKEIEEVFPAIRFFCKYVRYIDKSHMKPIRILFINI